MRITTLTPPTSLQTTLTFEPPRQKALMAITRSKHIPRNTKKVKKRKGEKEKENPMFMHQRECEHVILTLIFYYP